MSAVARVASVLAPWRRRLVTVVVVWLVLVLGAAVIGLSPAVPLLLLGVLAVMALGWFVADHLAANSVTVWPLVDGELGSGNRGDDFRVTSLAHRLEAADTRGEGREAVVRDLHAVLVGIVRERLFATHGIVPEEEPRWAEGVTPPELWQLVVGLPPADLYRPVVLDGILRRIENW
ncbi:hypothetical protein [Terracoccus luteus]|uniref:Uncharacterized protein n=1 Tax=Terracoccus luteus TaxID=53356 RepID=A0A839PYB9_9MICO|nr:hypothetical protein [Terracoccus luteus]MBB2987015.1 hypothetical protein [Terracoccus luteus]MCP2172666.1 hypothetical protein [Terracoccus luteus]